MANDLLKNSTKTFRPYLPALDATPYVPAKPAWRERVSTKVCTVESIPATYESYTVSETITVPVIDYETGQIIRREKRRVDKVLYRVKSPARQITRCTDVKSFVDHPAQPAQPAFPGRKEQFSTTLTDYHLGWEAGARSIKSVAYGGYAEFSMPLVTGVIAGLSTDKNSADANYATIGHALYFGNGVFKVMERGAEITGEFPYAAGDRFRISRTEGVVRYIQNGTLIHTSARPSLGDMRLDASMYSGADEINSPVLEEGAPEPPVEPVAEGSGSVRAPMAYGRDGSTASWGTSEVRAEARGYGAPHVPIPAYSIGIGTSYAPVASGYGLTGEVGEGSALVHPAMALGSAYSYGVGQSMAAPPMAAGYGKPSYPKGIELPPLLVDAVGSVHAPNSMDFALPALVVEAYSAARADCSLPGLTVEAEGTVQVLARVDFSLPVLIVETQAAVGVTGEFELGLPALIVEAVGGGWLDFMLPAALEIEATADVSGVGEFGFSLPGFEVEARGIVGLVGLFDFDLPALQSVAEAVFDFDLPMLQVLATGHVGDDFPVYEAYCTNLRTDIENGGHEMTRFTEFPLLRVLRFNGRYYGLAPDGLHRLGGARDGAEPIRWAVSTGTTDFGTRELKHLPSVYVGGRLGPGARFTVHEGEKRDVAYSYTTPRGQTAQNYRQLFGKGLRARYYSFTLAGDDEFELDGLHFEVAASKRRI